MWLFKEASLMKFHLSRNMKEKGEKWLNFGCFFNLELIRFAGGLDAGCEEKKGVRGDF